MQIGGQFFGLAAKATIKDDFLFSPGFSIEDGTGIDPDIQHFFKADGLSTELDKVAVILFGPASFIFNRSWMPAVRFVFKFYAIRASGGQPDELDHIGLSGEAHLKRVESQGAGQADAGPRFRLYGMGLFMQNAALGSEPVFGPEAFQLDQGALPRAEFQMLQSRYGQKLILRIHRYIIS